MRQNIHIHMSLYKFLDIHGCNRYRKFPDMTLGNFCCKSLDSQKNKSLYIQMCRSLYTSPCSFHCKVVHNAPDIQSHMNSHIVVYMLIRNLSGNRRHNHPYKNLYIRSCSCRCMILCINPCNSLGSNQLMIQKPPRLMEII